MIRDLTVVARRFPILTLAFGMVLTIRLAAEDPQPALTVLVADRVGIREDTTRKATYLAEQIFRAAGISTEFISCPLISSRPNFRFGGTPRSGRINMYLSIMSEPPAGLRLGPAAGFAAAPPGEPGSRIYVFYDRVLQAARAGKCTEFRVLGHIIAHEIGHLLGVRHSWGGIMCPNLNRLAVHRMLATSLRFNPDEVQTMRHNIRRVLTYTR